MTKEGVSIFVKTNLKFKETDIMHYCNEEDVECYAVLCNWRLNSSMYIS
jgi:hypothetical protein